MSILVWGPLTKETGLCFSQSLQNRCIVSRAFCTHFVDLPMWKPHKCYGYKIMPGRHLLQADFKVCRGSCVIGRPLLNIRPVFFEKRRGSCNQSPVFKKSKRQIFSFTYLKQPFHPLLWWPMTYFSPGGASRAQQACWNPKPLSTAPLSQWKVGVDLTTKFFFFKVLIKSPHIFHISNILIWNHLNTTLCNL